MTQRTVRIVMISGSLRDGAVNGAVVRTAAIRAPDWVGAEIYAGLGNLPPFNPDDDREGAPLHPAVTELRRELAAADAVLFSTPEYAGTLPGSFKNLLDWTVGGGEGAMHARDAFLGAVEQGLVRFIAIETDPSEALVRVHGTLAVVVGRTVMTSAGSDGEPATVHSRYTHVFDTEGGGWRLLSAQGTLIADAA